MPDPPGTGTGQQQRWSAMVAAVPWLGRLQPELVRRLDLAELVVPSGPVDRERRRVERRTGAYVVAYRRDAAPPPPGRVQLCQILAPATLDAPALAALRRAEQRLTGTGVVLCAYTRPLRWEILVA